MLIFSICLALTQDHPAHNYERELDAMLASVNNGQQQINVKNELPNDNGKKTQSWLVHTVHLESYLFTFVVFWFGFFLTNKSAIDLNRMHCGLAWVQRTPYRAWRERYLYPSQTTMHLSCYLRKRGLHTGEIGNINLTQDSHHWNISPRNESADQEEHGLKQRNCIWLTLCVSIFLYRILVTTDGWHL